MGVSAGSARFGDLGSDLAFRHRGQVLLLAYNLRLAVVGKSEELKPQPDPAAMNIRAAKGQVLLSKPWACDLRRNSCLWLIEFPGSACRATEQYLIPFLRTPFPHRRPSAQDPRRHRAKSVAAGGQDRRRCHEGSVNDHLVTPRYTGPLPRYSARGRTRVGGIEARAQSERRHNRDAASLSTRGAAGRGPFLSMRTLVV
jgi:hypothetical protein